MEEAQNVERELEGENQPRRRRPQTGEPEPEEGVEEVERGDEEMVGEDMAERNVTKDPLNWFGILVPQSLRHSQKQFIHGKPQSHRPMLYYSPLSMISNCRVWRTGHSAEQTHTPPNPVQRPLTQEEPPRRHHVITILLAMQIPVVYVYEIHRILAIYSKLHVLARQAP